MKHLVKKYLFDSMKHIFLLFYALLSLVPFLWVLLSSFKDNTAIFTRPFSLPETISFHNFDFAWRNGVILERMLTKAFITEAYDRGRRGLLINVRGTEPKEFLTIVSEEIDELNSTYKQIKVEKLIQCNCTKCVESTNPNFYDFEEDIQVRISRGKTTIECKNSYEDIDIKSLINGIFKKVLRKKNTDMKVFISYSHKDENFKDELLTHLKGLKLTTDIAMWDDRNIVAGEKWDEAISENLRASDIILLLISSDFIASNYIWEKELSLAIERDENGEAIVIPIFVRECDTTDMPFMKLQGLPKNAKPISKYKDKDEAYTEISKGIRQRLDKIERN